MKALIPVIGFSIFLLSCTEFEYSPHQVFDKDSPTNLNAKNLSRLLQTANDDTLRFVVSGDSQISQNAVVSLIRKINTLRGIDIVFLAGDISEFGTLKEMEWVVNESQKLKAPYFGVIGNHDLIANGSTVFKRMFGELNYSFTYGGVKFICHDTNGREYRFNGKVPDINWLESELAGAEDSKAFVAISHVRPFTVDFDRKLDTAYSNLFNSKPDFLASFHAHDHSFGEYYPDHSRVPFIVTTSIGERGFLLVEIVNNQLKYERVDF